MEFRNILWEVEDRIGTLTVNRPSVRNALNRAAVTEIGSVLEMAAADPEVGVLILTGAGEKAFVAGADIGELAQQAPIEGRDYALRGQAIFSRLESLGKPTLAAVNGYALGGGCELAMACTLRIASATAKFGQPEIREEGGRHLGVVVLARVHQQRPAPVLVFQGVVDRGHLHEVGPGAGHEMDLQGFHRGESNRYAKARRDEFCARLAFTQSLGLGEGGLCDTGAPGRPDDDSRGLQQNQEIQGQAVVLDVVEVVVELLLRVLEGGAVRKIDLRPAGYAWFYDMTAVVIGDLRRKLADELGPLRPRADEAHLALEDVPELGQFVHAEAAQEASEQRDPRIAR